VWSFFDDFCGSHNKNQTSDQSLNISTPIDILLSDRTLEKWDPHRHLEKRRLVSMVFSFFTVEVALNPIVLYHSVIMKAVGGEIGSASALAPKLGPLGLVSILILN
jgi:hypothetical protein